LTPPGGRGYRSLDDDPERHLRQIERSGIHIESPLLRSGLALVGANEHKRDDNGILTALEVTGLNLWGTKLVVLSACDTGVGEVRNGDGVYGLRRALVLAGSETQVMSLWAVPDKATQRLMVGYYRRLKEGKGRGEALRQAQLEMLKEVKRSHPYYWASFIQSGEWANLDGKR
jgi:CHAT domain-containing protein